MNDLTIILKQKLKPSKNETTSVVEKLSTAAILIPLVIQEGYWHLLFTRRTHFVSTHQNEVSFPGGSYEPTDINLEKTALRETNEEIGISFEKINILGALTPLTTITGFTVYPFVAVLVWPTSMKINTCEVDSVFTIPLFWLMDDNNHYEEDYYTDKYGIRRVIHYKDYQGEHLWGFTANVVRELINLIK